MESLMPIVSWRVMVPENSVFYERALESMKDTAFRLIIGKTSSTLPCKGKLASMASTKKSWMTFTTKGLGVHFVKHGYKISAANQNLHISGSIIYLSILCLTSYVSTNFQNEGMIIELNDAPFSHFSDSSNLQIYQAFQHQSCPNDTHSQPDCSTGY